MPLTGRLGLYLYLRRGFDWSYGRCCSCVRFVQFQRTDAERRLVVVLVQAGGSVQHRRLHPAGDDRVAPLQRRTAHLQPPAAPSPPQRHPGPPALSRLALRSQSHSRTVARGHDTVVSWTSGGTTASVL